MERKLGINIDGVVGIDVIDVLPLIKEIGFQTFFCEKYKMDEVTAIKRKADELGLEFEFIHAPFKEVNEMYLEGDGYLEIYNKMKEAIDSASANGIKTVVCHASGGWFPPEINDIMLARFDELVDYAKEKNVVVAFENLRKIGSICYFVDRYENNDSVRFCYDCGHEHCFTEVIPFIDVFGSKIACTHIHDNHGRYKDDKYKNGDQHLLPFDGDIDYKKMMDSLNKVGYTGSLMLEVGMRRDAKYTEMGVEAFLKTAYERIKKISAL